MSNTSPEGWKVVALARARARGVRWGMQDLAEGLHKVDRALALAMMALIRIYQLVVSPMLGPRCRFVPSCSRYALGALSEHGLGRGGWLAFARVCRCHPFHPGGYDPVPERSMAVGRNVGMAELVKEQRVERSGVGGSVALGKGVDT